MAREAPEDPYAGPRAGRPAAARRRARSRGRRRRRSVAGRAQGAGAGDRGCGARRRRASPTAKAPGSAPAARVVALATSQGFARGYTTSGYGGSASVIAGAGGGMQRDYAQPSASAIIADLDGARGDRPAGRRARGGAARSRPGWRAGRCRSCSIRASAASLIGHLLGAISGPAIARKTSFLLGREEEQLFDAGDRHRRRSAPAAAASVQAVRRRGRGDRARARLVDGGRLTGWLLNSASARQLGLETERPCHSRHRRRARRRRDQRPSRAGRAHRRRS